MKDDETKKKKTDVKLFLRLLKSDLIQNFISNFLFLLTISSLTFVSETVNSIFIRIQLCLMGINRICVKSIKIP